MKETAQNVNSAGTSAEPEIKTNVLYSAIPMPSNCNEILQWALGAICLFVCLFVYFHIIPRKGKFNGSYLQSNKLTCSIHSDQSVS